MTLLRNLGIAGMVAGGLLMAYALVVAGDARMGTFNAPSQLALDERLLLMRTAWAAVAGGATLVLSGLFALRRAQATAA